MEVRDAPTWRKSSFSGANGGQCVEVADHDGRVLVRDTKSNGAGPVLTCSAEGWRAFIRSIKSK